MTAWVKVCGLTRREDVEDAIAAGADAVGFVTDPASPRRVAPEEVGALCAGVEPVMAVLVTVDAEPTALLQAAATAGVTAVQPAGAHAAAAARAAIAAGLRVLRPVPVAGRVDLSTVPGDEIPLLDTARSGQHGGTGQTFYWELAAGLGRDVIIAGGLRPDNVAEALRRSGAWGVDASSRLERAPGIKDAGLVRAFVDAAKAR